MNLEFAKYKRRFKTPFRYGTHSLIEREGVLLRKKTATATFYSEASPLFSHSAEQIQDVLDRLRGKSQKALPSIKFALTGLLAQEKWSGHHFEKTVYANALLQNGLSRQETKDQVGALSSLGFKSIKCKINNENFEQTLDNLSQIEIKKMPVRFRLDANQSFSGRDDFDLFLRIVSKHQLAAKIEYLEEPYLDCWNDLAPGSFVRLAADESAHSISDLKKLESAKCTPDYIICKPTVLGFIPSLQKSKLVLSSALEAEAGRRALWALALECGVGTSVGLSTGFLFEQNFLKDLPFRNAVPELDPAEEVYYESLDWQPTTIHAQEFL